MAVTRFGRDDPDPDGELVAEIQYAYDHAAEEWATGPAAVYRRLAAGLVEGCPDPLVGRLVLDLGAGTGVASEVLVDAGARPVGVDLAPAMLAYQRAHRPPGVAGDARALPFHDRAFAAVVAACSLNHVPDPVLALGECRRVTQVNGSVLASTFPGNADHPAKEVVEAALEQYGYRRPRWYRAFKERLVARTGDAEALGGAAVEAGLADVRVTLVDVEAELDRAERAVEWRLNMPHTIGFVSRLSPRTRAELRARATAELPASLPSSVPMLVLHARVG